MQIKGSDIRWLRLAILQAEQAPHAQWRVGAVLVKGGSVLSSGFNRYRNDPSLVNLHEVSYHAEEAAIRRAGDPYGATLYVARIKRGGDLGMAKPCQKCQQIIIGNGVHTVVWSTSDGLFKERTSALCAEFLSV